MSAPTVILELREKLEALASRWEAWAGEHSDRGRVRRVVMELREILAETTDQPEEPEPPRGKHRWEWYRDLAGTENLCCGYIAGWAMRDGRWFAGYHAKKDTFAKGKEQTQAEAQAALLKAVQDSGLYGIVELGQPWRWPKAEEPEPLPESAIDSKPRPTAISDLRERVAELEHKATAAAKTRTRTWTRLGFLAHNVEGAEVGIGLLIGRVEALEARLSTVEARCHGLRSTQDDSAGRVPVWEWRHRISPDRLDLCCDGVDPLGAACAFDFGRWVAWTRKGAKAAASGNATDLEAAKAAALAAVNASGLWGHVEVGQPYREVRDGE